MHLEGDVKYIELRLLLSIDCKEKSRKITQILSFLNANGFITHLTILSLGDINAEDIIEHDNVMSLTIYMIDNTFKFKFWNGITVTWFSHTQDLFDEIRTGREEFASLYDKYEPITEILLDFKQKWTTFIQNIRYQYHPNADIELTYNIVFFEDKYVDEILKKINKQITLLDRDVVKNLHFDIQISYASSGCIPCQKKARENNEN